MPRFSNNVDLLQNELRNARVQNLTADPATGVIGQVYYNTTSGKLRICTSGVGPVWADVASAATPDATTGSKGVVQLSGDLAGTAASPQIAAGAILDADINVAAGIALSKLAVDPRARSTHTGTQTAATISDFDTQVRTSRLDQMAPPTTPVVANGQRITGVADPTGTQDAATKNYVDNTVAGLDAKGSVRAASTGNLALTGTQTIDAVNVLAGDRVLAKDQTDPTQNGIYVVAAGAWSRAPDADSWADLPSAFTWVEQGTVNADTGWTATVDQGGTLGTTAITWTQFAASTTIQAGNGLTKTGQSIALTTPVSVANGGTGANSAAGARGAISAAGMYSSAVHGAGTTITIAQAAHGLAASQALIVAVLEVATGDIVYPDINISATGTVTVTFASAVAANSYRVTIHG